MNEPGSITVLLMFVLRLAIPLAVMLAVAYLYDHLSVNHDWRSHRPLSGPGWLIPASCPVKERVVTACAARPNVPCWLALELQEGHVPQECLLCATFKNAESHRRQATGA